MFWLLASFFLPNSISLRLIQRSSKWKAKISKHLESRFQRLTYISVINSTHSKTHMYFFSHRLKNTKRIQNTPQNATKCRKLRPLRRFFTKTPQFYNSRKVQIGKNSHLLSTKLRSNANEIVYVFRLLRFLVTVVSTYTGKSAIYAYFVWKNSFSEKERSNTSINLYKHICIMAQVKGCRTGMLLVCWTEALKKILNCKHFVRNPSLGKNIRANVTLKFNIRNEAKREYAE